MHPRALTDFSLTASVRADLLKQPSHFIWILENTIVEGGVKLVDFGDAMESFCEYGLRIICFTLLAFKLSGSLVI